MKKGKQIKQTEEDERFKQVFTDPRFVEVPKKIKKVQIDNRFKQKLASKEFNTIAKVDKYGRPITTQDTSMLKFYNLKEEGEQ